ILFRCRYVLVGLIVVYGLLLALAQTRVVLVGVVTRAQRSGAMATGLLAITARISIALSLVALSILSHGTWLWLRVLCRIPGRRREATDGPAPGIEAFAKYFGRTRGVAPLVIFALLTAATLRDLTAAGASDDARQLLTAAAIGILAGGAFLYSRE